MSKGKYRKSNRCTELNVEDDNEQTEVAEELAGELAGLTAEAAKGIQRADSMADIQTVLREIREFRRENSESLKEIKEDIRRANSRIDEVETRVVESEDRIQNIEGATLELLELQKQFGARLTDQEGRLRRENVRIHGVKEGAEENAESVIAFVEKLLREKLELPPSFEFGIERAHRALASRPPRGVPPRSIVVKFRSYRSKEEIIKTAWQKKGFMYEGKKVFLDHDYAPEVMLKRKEYIEAKKVLKEKNIRFQTPFPAKMRVFYEGETRVYNTAEEATKDMVARGIKVNIVKPAEDWVEKIGRLMWRASQARDGQGPPEASQGFIRKLQAYRRR